VSADTAPADADDGHRARGLKFWAAASGLPVEQPRAPFREAFVDFAAAEVWSRPGLSRKERWWITLSCVTIAAQPVPIKSHLEAALRSGDTTVAELREFARHLAVYAGWPLASFADSIIDELEGGATNLDDVVAENRVAAN
jgi:4-carboxymuconolactone decarboxylase